MRVPWEAEGGQAGRTGQWDHGWSRAGAVEHPGTCPSRDCPITVAQPLSSRVDQSLLLPAPLSHGSWWLMMSVSLLSVNLLASALANSQ